MASSELLVLYRHMARARAFELILADLWQQGLISGEMHLGTGEEAICAGIAIHLRPGDASTLDHRPTPLLIMRGVDPGAILREVLGRDDGLCRGWGGHMHLFAREHLSASSGIVGAAAPLGAGFALAAQMMRPGTVAVALFGEGAMNQGMVMETLNLAAVWTLPLVLVCKDNRWAISTESARVTAGDLVERARAFGVPAQRVDGLDVVAVAKAAGDAIERARAGGGPGFMLATCSRLDGHLLGDPMRRGAAHPISAGGPMLRRIGGALLSRRGARVRQRLAGVASIANTLRAASRERRDRPEDPLFRTRQALVDSSDGLAAIDAEVQGEFEAVLSSVLKVGD